MRRIFGLLGSTIPWLGLPIVPRSSSGPR
jgi:hypothetical protein